MKVILTLLATVAVALAANFTEEWEHWKKVRFKPLDCTIACCCSVQSHYPMIVISNILVSAIVVLLSMAGYSVAINASNSMI